MLMPALMSARMVDANQASTPACHRQLWTSCKQTYLGTRACCGLSTLYSPKIARLQRACEATLALQASSQAFNLSSPYAVLPLDHVGPVAHTPPDNTTAPQQQLQKPHVYNASASAATHRMPSIPAHL